MKRRMRRTYRRRTRRRGSRRFGSRARYSRRVIKNFLNVKRTFCLSDWTFNTASTSGFWNYYTYTLGDLPSYAEFASVFDEYRIRAIKVTFRPQVDGVVGVNLDQATATTAQNAVEWLHTCVDPMSTVIPSGTYTTSNLNSFLENSNVRSRRANKALSVYFRPIMVDGVSGSGTAAARVSNRTWIRTSETAAVYRGFHAYRQVPNTAAVAGFKLTPFVTYYLQFRNCR